MSEQSPEAPNEELHKTLEGVVEAMIRTDAEREYINETLKALEEKHEVSKKVLRNVAKARKDDQYREKAEENEAFEHLYESIYGPNE